MGYGRDGLKLTDGEYEDLLDLTDGRCWICARPEKAEGRRLAIDHDHRTGAVRGLLCTSCNRRLGSTNDPEWLRRAAEYLEVAARAFGDTCDRCDSSYPAPSRLVLHKGTGTTFLHYCACGAMWPCSYKTAGIPFAWELSGVPAPPDRPELLETGAASRAGYPEDPGFADRRRAHDHRSRTYPRDKAEARAEEAGRGLAAGVGWEEIW